MPFSSYKYCGNELPHDYYRYLILFLNLMYIYILIKSKIISNQIFSHSYSNNIQITFNSMSNQYKGFKLEYSTAKCDRNYTSEQGRIYHHEFSNCRFTITVPANRTISLYFNQFSIYDAEHCIHNALQVR